jgi:hypothetical protein
LRQALLVRVRIGIVDMLGDRALQMIRGAKTEGTGIADVEFDQGTALGLELAGATGEFTADFVTDFAQRLARYQWSVVHGPNQVKVRPRLTEINRAL